MASFGESLRRERELRGITLPELSNATKISLRHLTALENDRFAQLPGGVFNRGFVRVIARYLNLDEHHWVGEYVRAAHEEPEILARYAPPSSPPAVGSRRGMWSFALLVVVFGLGAYLVHEVRLRRAAEAAPPVLATPSPPSQIQTSPAIPAEPPALEPARTLQAQRPLPGSEPAAESATPPAGRPGELRLQVDALENAWVSVTVDGESLYTAVMKPGETRTFRGAQRIEFTTGNASAIVLTLNGETLPPLGNPGERKNLTLSAKDLKPATP